MKIYSSGSTPLLSVNDVKIKWLTSAFNKSLLLVGVFLLINFAGWAQTTLVNYDFNTGTAYPLNSTSGTNGGQASIASGITCSGTSTEAFVTFGGTASGGAAFASNATAGNALSMNNSSGTNTKYFQFQFGGASLNTYSSYKIYFQAQRSGTGATTMTIAYSTDGTTYNNFGTTQAPGNGSFAECSFNLSGITAINAQTAVYFRILVSGASGAGTLRIDNFQVQATASGPSASLSTSPSSFTGLNYSGAGPSSSSATFSITGSNLSPASGNITITPPTNFEVYNPATASWVANPATFTIAYSSASFTNMASGSFVRLKAGLGSGSYSQSVGLSGGGATASIAVSGTVTGTPPTNDDCSGATSLTVDAAAISGTSLDATQSLAGITCIVPPSGATLADVWYSFTATNAKQTVTVIPSASYDAVVDVRSGACNGTNIGCADGFGAGGTETVNLTGLTVGVVYFIRVYHFDGGASATPTFTISVKESITYTWTGTTNSTWLATTNWDQGNYPQAFNHVAYFNSNAQTPTTGINMNTLGGTLTIGAFNFGTGATTARTINNSSTTASGTVTLSGVTLNGVSNTIIWNQSSANHTITNGSSQPLGIALGNTTNNIINIDGAGGITIGSAISGANPLTKTGSGAGVLTLTGPNTYTGATTITAGELRLNPAANITPNTQVVLNGGKLSTTGITATRTIVNASTLKLDASSSIDLGSAEHSLKFASSSTTLNSIVWAGTTLTINGWNGTAGQSNAAGNKIFIGTTATGLDAAQLAKISFTGFPGIPKLLSTGELVPPGPVLTITGTPTDQGSSCVGSAAASNTYTINNAGANASITSVSSSNGQFVVSGLPSLPFTLNNGATQTFQVTFTASGPGGQSANITANSSTANTTTTPIGLTGNGVAPSVAPTGSTGAATVCAGGSSTLTLTGGSVGGGTVEWYTGSCGGTLVSTGNGYVAGPGTYYGAYKNSATCGGGLTACQTVVVGLTNTNTWTGGTSSWSTGGNWSCGTIPTSGQDVVIANGGHPTLDVDFTAAGSLTLQSTSSLTVAPTITLTVSGAADFGGQPVTFQSNASGSAAFGNLTGSVTGDGAVTVERFIPATARAWRLLTIPVASSTATIRDAWAGAAPIASAGAASGEAAGSGTLITGHGYANAGTANAANFDYIDLPGTASSIRKYVGGNWPSTAGATPSMSTTFNSADQGYMLFVRGDRKVTSGNGTPATNVLNPTTLRPTGSLKTGTQGYALTATFVKVVGNPYASAIDFATAYGHNGTVAEKRFWRWDANNGSNGGYVIVQDDGLGGWETVPNEGSINITQIQSGQAVFLKGASGGTFNIAESDKVPAGTPVTVPVVFDATNAPGKLFTNMYFDNGVDGLKLIDGVQARFADGNSVDMDANDLSKISNFNENISFLRNGNALSVEAHPTVTNSDILYLSTEKLAVRNYAFKFTSKNMQSGITAILQDTYLGKESEISTTDNALTDYHFTVTADAASAATDRFRIVFKGGTLPLTLTNAKAYSLSSGVQVDWKTVNERGLRSYEVEKSIDGRSFAKATTIAATGAGAYGWYDAAPVKGNNYYRIKGVGTNGDASYSQVLMVNLNSGKSAFSVYPNPVKGGIVGVQFSNMEKGKYSMVVYNSAGQKVVSRDITHLGGSATEEINLGTMASGVYRISLIGTGGNVQNQTLVIQK